MIIIYGKPTGKGRPKFARVSNFVRTYTPGETISYENLVKIEYKNQSGKYFENEALRVKIFVFCEIPKSSTKKKSLLMSKNQIRPIKKPDVDNIAKIILDALNKIAFRDDTQVVELLIFKYYTTERERVEFDIETI